MVPAAVQGDDSETWNGRWLISDGIASAESRRDAAIRASTADMNVLARRIARRRLRARAPLPHHVSVDGEGETFRAVVGDHVLDFAADGSRHSIRGARGDSFIASQRLQGRRLEQQIRSDDATLTQTLELSEDGLTLTLRVQIASPQLPRDVTYALTFRRG
ncbi:MAG: hypothetical protein ACI9KE_000935 [Polyangiales bacterium]|jgi:hypothetical protein